MRFIDWNGSGRLDPSDISTSVVMEEGRRENRSENYPDDLDDCKSPDNLDEPNEADEPSDAGCGCIAAIIAVIVVILILLVI